MQTGFPWHHPEVPHAQLLGGMSWWDYLNRLLAGVLVSVGIEDARASALVSQFRNEYLNLAYWSLYDDAIETLAALRATVIRNCILSNHVPELQQLVDGLGLAPYVEQVFSSGRLGFEKPNERIFHMARTAMDDPSECFMVGDGFRGDVLGAIACGMRAVLVHGANDEGYQDYSEDLRGAARIIVKALQPQGAGSCS
jgi:putative hydrolase of the HAD superfamily